MSLSPFTIYQGATKKTCDVASVVTEANKKFIVDVSTVQTNQFNHDSIICSIQFSNILPDPVAATSKGWRIGVAVEVKGEGSPTWWLPVGIIFSPFSDPDQGSRHVIGIAPNIFNIDEGVPLDLFDGSAVTTRISRQQGVLGADFRIAMTVFDIFGAVAPHALTSFDVEIFGEAYDHAG